MRGCAENISISSAVCHKTVKQNQTHVVLAAGPNTHNTHMHARTRARTKQACYLLTEHTENL